MPAEFCASRASAAYSKKERPNRQPLFETDEGVTLFVVGTAPAESCTVDACCCVGYNSQLDRRVRGTAGGIANRHQQRLSCSSIQRMVKQFHIATATYAEKADYPG